MHKDALTLISCWFLSLIIALLVNIFFASGIQFDHLISIQLWYIVNLCAFFNPPLNIFYYLFGLLKCISKCAPYLKIREYVKFVFLFVLFASIQLGGKMPLFIKMR